jgi:hypothetical protein
VNSLEDGQWRFSPASVSSKRAFPASHRSV